ncbi:hypothetical protein Tco_0554816 [Tanacetum coccineum]
MLGRQMELVGDETKIVPLYYHVFENFEIQFGREEFCLVTGLKFRVEYWADYNDEDEPIPLRRRVFPSSLSCILQLVLLGVEDRRVVPDWILRDANVRRWPSLYATEPTNKVDKKTYSIFGFTWAFKTWILEVFRAGPNEYYTRHRRYHRVVAWSSNKKFYRHMLRDFLHEQRSGLDQMMKQGQNIFEKMNKFMKDMSVGTGANKEPIIVDQHYGISNLSGFQSMPGGLSSFQTSTNNSFFNMGTPTNWQTPMPSQPGSYNWQRQMPSYTPTPNWQPLSRRILNKLERPRREQRPSVYMQSPYTPLPPTTELPKKRVGKTKKKCKNDNLSPLNLGNAFAYDNAGGDDVVITGVYDTGIYFTYENVDPNKVYMPINVGGNH